MRRCCREGDAAPHGRAAFTTKADGQMYMCPKRGDRLGLKTWPHGPASRTVRSKIPRIRPSTVLGLGPF